MRAILRPTPSCARASNGTSGQKRAPHAGAARQHLRSASKIVASGVNQKGVDIDAVERFWVEGIGVDYLIKRKFLTWGVNTTLDASRSADPAPYLNTDELPCPFIFERLNIDSRGNVMVCGYDISANTSMGNVEPRPFAISGMAKASVSIATSIWPAAATTSRFARSAPIGSTAPGSITTGKS